MSERLDVPAFPAADFSNSNADLHAVGEDLKLGIPNSLGNDIHQGTSFAARVSGLAAYLALRRTRGKEVADPQTADATAQVGKRNQRVVIVPTPPYWHWTLPKATSASDAQFSGNDGTL
ncbi:MAG: hypothetical protein IPG64_20430 [Haliea sp.]|nr:hypothetical protein [Haliea sp.]